MSKQAMEMALEALTVLVDEDGIGPEYMVDKAKLAISALKEAIAQQGEPVAYQFQDRSGEWCNFVNQEQYENTVYDGSWPIRALYTSAPSNEDTPAMFEKEPLPDYIFKGYDND